MSAAAPGADALPADLEPSARISYWSLVWEQLTKNRIAMLGLWFIAGFVWLAVFAPLISLDQPILVVADGQWSSPWAVSLFNRLFFENAVDIFFNLLLVALPLYVAVWFAVSRWQGERFGRVRGRLLRWLLLAQVAAFALIAPERLGPLDNPFHFTERVAPWSRSVDSEKVFTVFPMRAYNYRDTDPARSVLPPSAAHWLGTDKEGRDVFTRLVYGTRISLTIGVVAVAIYVVIGVVLGALAGYFGGWVDVAVSRAIEVMICFPSFFLIITLAAMIEARSIFHVMVIIGITSWTGVARLTRAEFLRHKALEYAQAALALGVSRRRVIFRHILPNAIAPVLVSATFGVAAAILTESGLAFLGLGDLSVPSWGGILSTGRAESKLWLILAPGVAIFVLVSVLNLVGEGLRDALDPKLRR